MKAHLFSKMSQGLLLLSALLATSCKESSNNFFVPDHEAPSLVSVTPANGETAEENNTILLTFNEYVKAGEGKANFNGEEVELTFKGKTASYAYTALDYNQVCQFSLPKGAVIDFQGNVFEGVSIQFTIRERPQPEARIFDAVVSPDGKGNYTSIQKAIDNVPSKRTEPWLISWQTERMKNKLLFLKTNRIFISSDRMWIRQLSSYELTAQPKPVRLIRMCGSTLIRT